MNISGVVQDVNTKKVQIKNGPNAGKDGFVRSIVVDGKTISFGFKAAPSKGTVFNGEISDEPNNFGEYQLLRFGGTSAATIANVDVSAGYSRKSGNSKGFPIEVTDHATSICRQSGLKAAIDTLSYLNTSLIPENAEELVDLVLSIAGTYAKWTTGQLEAEEAEKMLASLTHEQGA